MKRVLLTPTAQQLKQIRPLLANVGRSGGAMMAQVFTDGIHVAYIDEETAKQIAQVSGVSYLPKSNSGKAAFNEACLRDKKEGAA